LRARSEVWLPLAAEALDRHGLRLANDAFAGPGGSYPAVISRDTVVKFFGFAGAWAATWENERRAQERLALDPRILAPTLLGAGQIFPGKDQPLPYLLLSRVPGIDWEDARPDQDSRLQVAADLGEQLRLVHALPATDLPTIDTWRDRSMSDGARSGLFPVLLLDQIDDWLETVPVAPPRFVHSDLFVRHPFMENGRLTGIIDWGDAMTADPHVELGKLHLDVFEGDKRLLGAFLDAYGWPVDDQFPRRALAMSLRRHTQIHGQHGEGGDMFYRLPDLLAGKRIESLDDLAIELFGPGA
jgi:aminoglycoside phosphotransferase